ncbi:transcription antitermination factor NusB [Lactococcus termiticola]|uniref:Transcription antitermination protein NusB n=1 Tax=Lactococcus termiticola TaxID=2169526 RepID=A0A2R5HIW5_9LACT|nr:transcription antitermination factor NusB [Lactococcus termiticola]GBG96330.1 transcription antitermination factor NusB [Lactococcus termiticola]
MPKLSQHEIRQKVLQALFNLELIDNIQKEIDKEAKAKRESAEKLQLKLDKKQHFAKEDDFTAQIEIKDLTREVNSIKLQADEAERFKIEAKPGAVEQFVFSYQEELSDEDEIVELPAFFTELLEGVEAYQEELDAKIEQYLAKGWSLERLTNVERCVLRIGAYEMLKTDISKKIALDEAIELAKDFSDETSGKFVNGLLKNLI